MSRDAIVVGGGIAGLACGWRLARSGVDVLVLEGEPVAGGNVRSEEENGFRMERGPHTFLASADDIFDLAEEVGVADQIVPSRPAAGRRFVARGGRLHAIPTGPWSFLTTPLLSARSKWTLATEPFRLERGNEGDTASRFFERRFGAEAARVLAGAFVSGVYAGDPETLSAPAAFPLFWSFEKETGSMIRGFYRYMKRKKAARAALGDQAPKKRQGLYSLREGLGQLSAAVARRLGERCRTRAAVEAIERNGGGFTVRTRETDLRAAEVVVAVPPGEAARLLGPLDPELAEPLAAVPMAPVAVTHLCFSDRASGVPDGFGFLVPRGEGIRTLGVLFPSRLFDGRAPEGGDLLAGFVGGMTDPGALDLDDDSIAMIVFGDLERLCGLEIRPASCRVVRYRRAIPQLVVGHLERMDRIRRRLTRFRGLHLAGNYLHGVGMKEAVRSGFEAAAAVRDSERG